MVVAALEWVAAGAPGGVMVYETGAANLVHNERRGRSRTDRVNDMLRLLARGPGTRARLVAVWHRRGAPRAKLAGAPPRGALQAYLGPSLTPAPRRSSIRGSTLESLAACLAARQH